MDGQIIFAGGQFDHEQNSTSRVVAYNIETRKWTELQPLPAARQGAAMGVFGNKIIVAMGASKTSSPQSTVWVGYR